MSCITGDECLLRNNSNGYGEMDGDEDDDDDILPADQSLELVYKSEPYSQSDDNQTNGFHISNGSIDYNDDDDDIYSVHSECSASAEGKSVNYLTSPESSVALFKFFTNQIQHLPWKL